MNLQQLYYFRTLAEVKHFTKASMQLNVTQSSLSHSINDLEAELGIGLFDRNNRQVSLTKYGELYLEYVNEALDILDAGRIKLEDFISPEQGGVSLQFVSSINPFITYLMSRYFEDTGSQTTFQLHQESNRLIQRNLLSGEADLGIGAMFENVPEIRSSKLGNHELVLIVSEKHPLAQQDSVDLRDIKGCSFVAYKRPECTIRDLIDSILDDFDVHPRIVTETIHDTMVYSSVAANFGVSLVPAPLAGYHYRLKALRVENDIPSHVLYLKWKDVKFMSPAVKRVRDYIIAHQGLFDEFRAPH